MRLVIHNDILSVYGATNPIVTRCTFKCKTCSHYNFYFSECYKYTHDYRGWNHVICGCCTGWKMEGYY